MIDKVLRGDQHQTSLGNIGQVKRYAPNVVINTTQGIALLTEKNVPNVKYLAILQEYVRQGTLTLTWFWIPCQTWGQRKQCYSSQ